jgi:hypothetical protein
MLCERQWVLDNVEIRANVLYLLLRPLVLAMKAFLSIDLSPVVWKRLTGQALTLDDLASFDSVAANFLRVRVLRCGGLYASVSTFFRRGRGGLLS